MYRTYIHNILGKVRVGYVHEVRKRGSVSLSLSSRSQSVGFMRQSRRRYIVGFQHPFAVPTVTPPLQLSAAPICKASRPTTVTRGGHYAFAPSAISTVIFLAIRGEMRRPRANVCLVHYKYIIARDTTGRYGYREAYIDIGYAETRLKSSEPSITRPQRACGHFTHAQLVSGGEGMIESG